MLFPATLGLQPHGGLAWSAWDAPALFQTQLPVRLIFLPFFNPGIVLQEVVGLLGRWLFRLHFLSCAGGLQMRAVSLCKAVFSAAAQPGKACPRCMPFHGDVGTSSCWGFACPWPGGTLHVRGSADIHGGGHPGTPVRLVVVFLPPKISGLLDGSQGAKQSAVSAESSQVAQPAWFLNGKPSQMTLEGSLQQAPIFLVVLQSLWHCLAFPHCEPRLT